MAIAMGYDEAIKKQFRQSGRDISSTPFFGSRKNPDLPLAQLNQMGPGYNSSTHFHVTDEFQVVIDGKGTLGRHQLAPYGLHFARAYTPYGPLVADAGQGLRFFVMRVHPDTGGQHLPEKRDLLKQVPNRRPEQFTCSPTFPMLQTGAQGAGIVLEPIPGMRDERGLAAYTLSMRPGTEALAPDPSLGEGQFVVVLKGSLSYENEPLKAPALVFVRPDEGPFRIRAGSEGLDAMVLNFPRPLTPVAGGPNV